MRSRLVSPTMMMSNGFWFMSLEFALILSSIALSFLFNVSMLLLLSFSFAFSSIIGCIVF